MSRPRPPSVSRWPAIAATVAVSACRPSGGGEAPRAPDVRAAPAASAAALPAPPPSPAPRERVILFVWDGLRPDSVSPEDTPHLWEMARQGTTFTDHHSTFPTFTMVNAATLATGGFPRTSGFSSNWVWQPQAPRRSPSGTPLVDAQGSALHYEQPLFTEDFVTLQDLDAFFDGELLMVKSLFEAAQAGGLGTLALGKSGPAFLQDRKGRGSVIDEKGVWPLALVRELQRKDVKLPRGTPEAHAPGDVSLHEDNGDPTAIPPSKKLADGKTHDPDGAQSAPASAANAYLMSLYLEHLLPEKAPELTVLWNRNPDTAQHWYGPGTRSVKQALRELDAQLGQVLDRLASLGWLETTNVMVVSDHGHSSVSGPLEAFPLRKLVPSGEEGAKVGAIDDAGYSVSGDVRLADLLTRLGRFHAYDGIGCLFNPVMSGIGKDGNPLYAVRTDDAAGTVCGKDPKTGAGNARYTTPPYKVPSPLPRDAVIVGVNGGTDLVYVPSHEEALLARLVRFLQARPEVGALFLSSRYATLPGTLPMEALRVEAPDSRRNPDLYVSYTWDENAVVAGMRGIIYEGAQNYRGMHGSFSPVDVHNTLIALGPGFRKSWKDPLPTGNVDVAPTIARLLHLELPQAEGRVLEEALATAAVATSTYEVKKEVVASATATLPKIFTPTDTNGTRVEPKKSRYRSILQFRDLVHEGRTSRYFDWAKAERE